MPLSGAQPGQHLKRLMSSHWSVFATRPHTNTPLPHTHTHTALPALCTTHVRTAACCSVFYNEAAAECIPFGNYKDGSVLSFKVRNGLWVRSAAAAPAESTVSDYMKAMLRTKDAPVHPASAGAQPAAAHPVYEKYEYEYNDEKVQVEAVRGKADVFMGHISDVEESGERRDYADSDDVYGGVLEFVAGFVLTDGTVAYPELPDGEARVIGRRRDWESTGAVPLVRPGAYWIKVRGHAIAQGCVTCVFVCGEGGNGTEVREGTYIQLNLTYIQLNLTLTAIM